MDITRLHNLAISSTGFIFDPVSGNSFNTNETGVMILTKLKEGIDIATISQLLKDNYDVTFETPEQDILHFIELLQSNYLV